MIMKKILYSSVVILLLFVFLVWKSQRTHKNEEEHVLIKVPELEKGDLILKNGKGIVSKKIVKSLGEKVPYSHLGVYYSDNDTAYIIHSVSGDDTKQDGVQKISVKEFIKDVKPGALLFVRRKTNKEMRNKFAENANQMANKKLGFDLEFDMYDSSRIYCTELAYWSFKKVGDSIELKTKEIGGLQVILFETLRDEEFFEILN